MVASTSIVDADTDASAQLRALAAPCELGPGVLECVSSMLDDDDSDSDDEHRVRTCEGTRQQRRPCLSEGARSNFAALL